MKFQLVARRRKPFREWTVRTFQAPSDREARQLATLTSDGIADADSVGIYRLTPTRNLVARFRLDPVSRRPEPDERVDPR